MLVTAASVQERDGTRPALERLPELFDKITLVWADGIYAGRLVDWAKEKLQLALQIVKRRDDVKGFIVLPRRWAVERTLSWISQRRRCVRNYERLPEHHETMIMSRRLARSTTAQPTIVRRSPSRHGSRPRSLRAGCLIYAQPGTMRRMKPDFNLVSALRRGTLEFCVLAVLAERERYGLELVRHLSEAFMMTFSEGTLYPLLSRLRRAGKIATVWRESPLGPPRRYYSLTPRGESALAEFREEWVVFRSAVDRIIGTEAL